MDQFATPITTIGHDFRTCHTMKINIMANPATIQVAHGIQLCLSVCNQECFDEPLQRCRAMIGY